MRFATFGHDGRARSGVVTDATTVRPLPEGTTVLELVRRGLSGLLHAGKQATGPEIPLAQVRLLPPLEPPTVRDFVAFEEHVEGVVRSVSGDATGGPEWFQAPPFYFTTPYARVGGHDPGPVPPGCHQLDFELEVAAVIGRAGTNLSPAD